MDLTNENYFTLEADRAFMSVSQFKSFLPQYGGCEAAALAQLKGEYKGPENAALLVGSYFHSHFDGTLDIFKQEHPEVFTKQGTLKSQYQQADGMINCLESDKYFKMLYDGQKEIPITFKLFGVDWKAKIDELSLDDGYFCDLKTVKDFESIWDDQLHSKVSFIQSRGYNLQIAVYKSGIESFFSTKDMDGYIVAVTKQSPPSHRIYQFTQEHYEHALAIVQENLPHIMDVKEGRIEPESCGKCEYCRQIETLENIYTFEEDEL